MLLLMAIHLSQVDVSVLNKSDTNSCDLSVSDHDINFDVLMCKAYGTTIVQSPDAQLESKWQS